MIGLGRLTDKGKKETYDFGLFLRERYKSFLPLEYNPDDITLISSDKDRTIQSSSLAAYALYKDYNFNATWAQPEQIPYEPIPVRHVPKEEDKYFQMTKKCPRWDQLYEESIAAFNSNYLDENPDVIEIYTSRKDNVSLFDPNRSVLSRLDPLIAFQDEILYNITHNLPTEDWCIQLISIKSYYGIKTSYYRATVDTEEKQRFYNGPLLQSVLNTFDKIKREKMALYCLHDKTLFTFMTTLGIDDKEVLLLPPTAAALMIELHEDQTLESGPYLEFWYRNDTSFEPHHLVIPGCGNPCYLSKVKELKKNVIPNNYEAECLLDIPPEPITENSQDSWLLLWIGAAVVVIIFGMILGMTRCRSSTYEKV
jgi:hypothetical protein